MRKALVYILISLMSLNSLSIRELLKLPVLCQHYMEHKSANNDISIMDFLSMHYWGTDLNDNDDNRDMQLPFKNITHSVVSVVFLPQNPAAALTAVYIQPLVNRVTQYKNNLYSCLYYSSLIKPPAL